MGGWEAQRFDRDLTTNSPRAYYDLTPGEAQNASVCQCRLTSTMKRATLGANASENVRRVPSAMAPIGALACECARVRVMRRAWVAGARLSTEGYPPSRPLGTGPRTADGPGPGRPLPTPPTRARTAPLIP